MCRLREGDRVSSGFVAGACGGVCEADAESGFGSSCERESG